ncbi:MAG: DUF1805 domain-containing protein [Caldiserica bacterium]|nr:DUF1805 domain-containing protein [Caldisericota bacterium]
MPGKGGEKIDPAKMIEIKPVNIDGKKVIGVKIGNPDSPVRAAAFVFIAKKGLVLCKSFQKEVLNKRDVAAAMVGGGLREIDDVLEAIIESCPSKAQALGVQDGMMGRNPSACLRD